MKRMHLWTLTGAALAFGTIAAVEKILPLTTVKPWRVVAKDHPGRFPNGYRPESYGLTAEHWTVRTPDGVDLKVWFLPASGQAAGTVILLHGRSNCKESLLDRAGTLVSNGYNCVMLDLRAHGESGGDYCTYGHYEKYDVQAVLDTVRRHVPEGPVGIWGLSLGGAIALQTLALDDRLAFGIIESTFDELPNVVMEYGADYLFGWRSRWLTDRVLGKSAVLAGFDPYGIRPVQSAATLERPLLFLHGSADNKIPLPFNRRNFDAVPVTTEKQWITVEGAGHSDVWEKGGPELHRQVLSRIDSFCRNRQS